MICNIKKPQEDYFIKQSLFLASSRVLVTGITSIHGWPIFSKLTELLPYSNLFGIRPPKMNIPDNGNIMASCITEKKNIKKIRDIFRPTHVVHCAGVCDLDVCEERPEWAHSINVEGARAITEIFGNEVPIIYMSSDLVFSGKDVPKYGYSENDLPGPINVAGKTILLAENEVRNCTDSCIIRLGLPLGDSINGKKGAIDWIEGRFKRNLPVTLFFDEYRSCVYCNEIDNVVLFAMIFGLRGLFHFGGKKRWSLYNIGEYVLKKGGYSPNLLKGIMRNKEVNGPPRIGDVSLNSSRLMDIMDKKFCNI